MKYFRNFPSLYYAINYKLVDGTKIRIIVTDTVTLCGNNEPSSFHFFVGGKKGDDQPKGPKNSALAEEHWTWIEDQLKEAKAYKSIEQIMLYFVHSYYGVTGIHT